MRLFLAVDPPPEVRDRLGRIAAVVCGADARIASAFRATAVENLHVTLHFLGDVEETLVPVLVEELGPTVDEPPFDLAVGRPAVFPGRGVPRGLSLVVLRGGDELARVQRELGARIARAGVALDPRPFSPHVTIARARRDRTRMGPVGATLAAVDVGESVWRVAHITLFESDLRGPQPQYGALHRVRLLSPRG
jgi:RNA 2',3'-cyclic 3'-phosphodiesterase